MGYLDGNLCKKIQKCSVIGNPNTNRCINCQAGYRKVSHDGPDYDECLTCSDHQALQNSTNNCITLTDCPADSKIYNCGSNLVPVYYCSHLPPDENKWYLDDGYTMYISPYLCNERTAGNRYLYEKLTKVECISSAKCISPAYQGYVVENECLYIINCTNVNPIDYTACKKCDKGSIVNKSSERPDLCTFVYGHLLMKQILLMIILAAFIFLI